MLRSDEKGCFFIRRAEVPAAPAWYAGKPE